MKHRSSPAALRARALDLGPYLGERLGGEVQVAAVSLASQGMSATTLLLELADGREIVIRGQETAKTNKGDQDGNEVQFHILRAAAKARVPAPPALFCEPDPDMLGVPFLATERLPGHAVVPWSREGHAILTEAGRGPAGDQLLDILVAIHKVPTDDEDLVRAFGAPPKSSTGDALDRLQASIDGSKHGVEEPILADALGWLRMHLRECSDPTLVHGDFRAGNLLFDDGRISGVLDWEFAHVGDPARDVAWLMAKSNRVSEDLACDMVPLNEVLDRYRRAGGRDIDPAAIAYWDVFMLVWTTAIWLRTTASWRAGALNDIRIARWTYALPGLRLMILDALEGVSR